MNKFLNKDWSWTFYLVNHNSRQKDTSSCGVYTLKFIQCWAMGRAPNITKSVSTQMLVVRLMLVYCIQLIFVYQTHARIARKFMALEIAMSKLADPFNSASFLNENRLGKETEVQGGMDVETGHGTWYILSSYYNPIFNVKGMLYVSLFFFFMETRQSTFTDTSTFFSHSLQ